MKNYSLERKKNEGLLEGEKRRLVSSGARRPCCGLTCGPRLLAGLVHVHFDLRVVVGDGLSHGDEAIHSHVDGLSDPAEGARRLVAPRPAPLPRGGYQRADLWVGRNPLVKRIMCCPSRPTGDGGVSIHLQPDVSQDQAASHCRRRRPAPQFLSPPAGYIIFPKDRLATQT